MCFYFLRTRTKFTFEVAARALRGSAAYLRHGMGPCCFPTFNSMQPCSFLHKVSSRVSCSMGLAMAEVIAQVLIR